MHKLESEPHARQNVEMTKPKQSNQPVLAPRAMLRRVSHCFQLFRSCRQMNPQFIADVWDLSPSRPESISRLPFWHFNLERQMSLLHRPVLLGDLLDDVQLQQPFRLDRP